MSQLRSHAKVVIIGGYGHRIGASLALGLILRDVILSRQPVEIEFLGARCKAILLREPPYDPTNSRLKA